jgi:hypothetical protein
LRTIHPESSHVLECKGSESLSHKPSADPFSIYIDLNGGQEANTSFAELPIPSSYSHIPPSSHIAPDFRDGIRMHKLIDLMYRLGPRATAVAKFAAGLAWSDLRA